MRLIGWNLGLNQNEAILVSNFQMTLKSAKAKICFKLNGSRPRDIQTFHFTSIKVGKAIQIPLEGCDSSVILKHI